MPSCESFHGNPLSSYPDLVGCRRSGWWRYRNWGRNRLRERLSSVEFKNKQQRRVVYLHIVGPNDSRETAAASHHGDILFPVDRIGDRRTRAGSTGFYFKQLLALIRAVCEQPPIVY